MFKKKPSPDFWEKFSKDYWEKKALLVKNFNSSITDIDEKEVFSMLVQYSDSCRRLKSSEGFKLFVDGQMLHPEETIDFLPRKSDKNLLGYNHRMEKDFSDYCLVCDELLQTSQKNWTKIQEFTNTLFSLVGFPNRFVEMGLYLGNYRKTPFGVHVDSCGVFSFPIFGQKFFRLWDPEFAKSHPTLDRSLNYNKFKKDSLILKAKPKDMTYWPSSAWHIAESDGTFNATWSLGVWVDRTHAENIETSLRPLFQKKLGNSGMQTLTPNFEVPDNGKILSLPKNYLDSIDKLRSITKNQLKDQLTRSWLQQVSMQGFKTATREILPSNFTTVRELKLPKGKKIFWAQLSSKKRILLAFEGVVVETNPSSELIELIKALNSEKTCRFEKYLKGRQKKTHFKVIKQLLK